MTFDSPSLSVGIVVFDTTASPVKVAGPTLMPLLYGNTYYGTFTPEDSKAYVIVKSVYTDDTLDTLDAAYNAGSESIFAQTIGGGGGSGDAETIYGYVDTVSEIIGFVDSN